MTNEEKKANKMFLVIRMTIVMVRFGYNFLNSPQDYQAKLKSLFKYEYSIKEITLALYKLEEAHIVSEADRTLGAIEQPEDY